MNSISTQIVRAARLFWNVRIVRISRRGKKANTDNELGHKMIVMSQSRFFGRARLQNSGSHFQYLSWDHSLDANVGSFVIVILQPICEVILHFLMLSNMCRSSHSGRTARLWHSTEAFCCGLPAWKSLGRMFRRSAHAMNLPLIYSEPWGA